MPTKEELLEQAKEAGVDVKQAQPKAEIEAALEDAGVAVEEPEAEAPAAEHPDTPSGLGLQAAEGLEGEEASEAYWKAYNEARWGTF